MGHIHPKVAEMIEAMASGVHGRAGLECTNLFIADRKLEEGTGAFQVSGVQSLDVSGACGFQSHQEPGLSTPPSTMSLAPGSHTHVREEKPWSRGAFLKVWHLDHLYQTHQGVGKVGEWGSGDFLRKPILEIIILQV